MIVGKIGVVGVKGEAGFRVVQLRPLIERDRTGPVEGARRAVDGSGAPVAGLPQGDQAGVQEADVARPRRQRRSSGSGSDRDGARREIRPSFARN